MLLRLSKQTGLKMRGLAEILVPIEHPEIVIGLVGPIGVDLAGVINSLRLQLSRVKYESELIRITNALSRLRLRTILFDEPIEKRYQSYMDAGNEVRERLNSHDSLALLSIGMVREVRSNITRDSDKPCPRQAYILS